MAILKVSFIFYIKQALADNFYLFACNMENFSYICPIFLRKVDSCIEMDNDKVLEIVNQKFTEYLIAKNCRKTPERYAILNLIYSDHRHFDMDSLYKAMTEQNFRVSRATLYNTMQLLMECNLVMKHQFGQNLSFYERAFNNELHHHLICTNCHSIREYKDAEIKSVIQGKKIHNFIPLHYSLYIFGMCNSCARRLKIKKLTT